VCSDYNMTMAAIDNLKYSITKGGNHFTALGLHFPHLSHRVPLWAVRKYMPEAGLQPNASGVIPAATNRFVPTGSPDIAQSQEVDGKVALALPYGKELYNYTVPSPIDDSFPEWFWSTIRLGYQSAITLTDYHVGLMLDEIDRLGIYNDTIVVLISDHGWSTGSHRHFAKHMNYDTSTRVTTIIRVPWKTNSIGKHTMATFELQDLYKTLASLAGLEQPPAEWRIDGTDQSALFDDPSTPLKTVAWSQYDRCP